MVNFTDDLKLKETLKELKEGKIDKTLDEYAVRPNYFDASLAKNA